MSDAERLKFAQELIERMVKEYGVQIVVSQTIKRIDDGSVIVSPAISLQLIEGWKAS